MDVCNSLDKRIILWDVNPNDWRCLPKKEIINRVVGRIKQGSIIDLHDYAEGIGENKELPGALETLIPFLRIKGYHFVTISELIK